MEIVLLEKINKVGGIGDVVTVADGYARNYLIPQKKALRATEQNIRFFEEKREQIEAENLRNKASAEDKIQALKDQAVFVLRQCSERGQLYGSVTARDIASMVSEKFFTIDKAQVIINTPIKLKGIHTIVIQLHPEVKTELLISVAPTLVEAEKQLHEEAQEKEAQKSKGKKAAEQNVAEEAEASEENNESAEVTSEETDDVSA